jgi:ubiquinone/menaquinone biosynthesis C-methylase UbiE
MKELTNQRYLLSEQYRDAANLNARIQLHVRFSTNKSDFSEWIFDHFDLAPDSRILELGCGPGGLWHKNLERIPGGWEITLSDLSMGMLRQAQTNLRNSRRSFNFSIADAQFLPFASESFDAVIANYMLYHVPDRPRAFSEIRRVLKPGGRIFAATAGSDHLRELFELADRVALNAAERTRGSELFSLENGENQLSPWFSQIRLDRRDNSLVVTEPGPLIDYYLSMSLYSFDEATLRGHLKIRKGQPSASSWYE